MTTEPIAAMLTSLRMTARAADVEASRFTDGWRYRTFAALVLAEGRWFTPPAADSVQRSGADLPPPAIPARAAGRATPGSSTSKAGPPRN